MNLTPYEMVALKNQNIYDKPQADSFIIGLRYAKTNHVCPSCLNSIGYELALKCPASKKQK